MAEKTKKKKSVWLFVVIAVLVILLFAVKGNYDEVNDFFNPKPVEIPPTPAEIELYKFLDLSNNNNTNIEIWLINIGEETATNITIYIRAWSEKGLLYDNYINPSTLLLRYNESNTAYYTLSSMNISQIYNTIEISWNTGHKVYSKTV